jgi:hypothetical protein
MLISTLTPHMMYFFRFCHFYVDIYTVYLESKIHFHCREIWKIHVRCGKIHFQNGMNNECCVATPQGWLVVNVEKLVARFQVESKIWKFVIQNHQLSRHTETFFHVKLSNYFYEHSTVYKLMMLMGI